MTELIEGQLRVSGGVVIGFDLTAALAAAGALGIDPVAVVELLPVIEARMVEAAHRQSASSGLEGRDV